MTMEIVAQILGRALLDEAFRGQLLNAPDQILEEFDLSVQEVEALKQLNADQFQQLNEAFQVHLDGAKADLAQASNFLKIEGIDGSITLDHKDWYLKKGSVEEGANFENAWSSKVVPSGSAAGSGLSLPVMLAIGAVVVGAITAGIFFFRGNTTIKQADTDFQSVSEATMAPDDEASPIFQLAVLESGPDSICLNGESLHLCAVPAGQAVELLGDSSEDPLMLPLTPEQAALLISASGGSPAGVTGFTVMMLAGPDTYQIKLPDSVTGNEAIFLSDVEGNLYFGSAAYFPDETATKDAEAADVPGNTSLAALAGTWETVPSAGTMTCEGSSMNISPEPPIQVVFDENGKAEFFEIEADSSTAQVTDSSDGIFLATVTTVANGEVVIGELEFSLVSPDLIEGTYLANFDNGCTFERPVTMNRISGSDAVGGETVAPLKPAEFSLESYFVSGDGFIPQLSICTGFPDVCMDGAAQSEPLEALLSEWSIFDTDIFMHMGGGGGAGKVNISNSCATSQTGTACVPASGKGDVYIPPYPADAGWGSKGIGPPTLVSVLDVDAVGLINGIFDLWFVTGIPQVDDWDGIVGINSELIQVYELDLETGQQELWENITLNFDVVEINTDQNRLFVVYLFEDEAAAQEAPAVVP